MRRSQPGPAQRVSWDQCCGSKYIWIRIQVRIQGYAINLKKKEIKNDFREKYNEIMVRYLLEELFSQLSL